MKRVLTVLLALVMVLSLAACATSQPTTGKTEPTNKPTNGTTKPTTGTTQPTTAPTEPTEPTEPTVPTDPTDPIPPVETVPPTNPDDGNTTEIVITDNADCTFKVVSFENTVFGYTMKVYLENKSAVSQMFSMSDVAVNDYMCDPFWACEVGAGMKQYSEVTFLAEDLNRNGITTPAKIEFKLTIYDYESWDAKEFFSDVCTIYPMGEDSYVDDGGYVTKNGDVVLVDNENCIVIVTGYEIDELWGYSVNLYIANKTSQTLAFSADDVTVNDLMLDPWWATEVAGGKRTHCSINWMTEIETYQVGDVTKIAFHLSASDPSSWEDIDFADVDCTLYPLGEEAYKPYEREALPTDIIILDNDYVTVTVVGIDPDGIWGYTVNLFIQNKSELNVRVDADDVSVNGFEIDPWWASSVSAGKCIFSSISWFASDFEFNGITTVEAIVMNLKVYDEEAWEPFTSDIVTINP